MNERKQHGFESGRRHRAARTALLALALCTIAVAGIVITVTNERHTYYTNGLTQPMTAASTTMKLESPAFAEGAAIPVEYTCDGEEVSPELRISGVPAAAKSLALIMEDPDTSIGTFVHWVVFNIPATTTSVASEKKNTSPTFGVGGLNGAGTTGYIGACPPSGTHRYIFRLFALDSDITAKRPPDASGLRKLMERHIIAETSFMGRYGRGT